MKTYYRFENGRINKRNFSSKPYGFWHESEKKALKEKIKDLKWNINEDTKMMKVILKVLKKLDKGISTRGEEE